MRLRLAVFDAYGTLFDLQAAVARVAAQPMGLPLRGIEASFLADWRQKQLEYSWLRTIAARPADFANLTADALDWALSARKMADPGLRTALLDAFRCPPAFADAVPLLESLGEAGMARVVLSNGTLPWLTDAVGVAGLARFFDAILSVDGLGQFKPAPRVYDLVGARFGTQREEVLFISANGWDAAGAAGYGFRTVWINRAGLPVDRLWAQPAHVLPHLAAVKDLL